MSNLARQRKGFYPLALLLVCALVLQGCSSRINFGFNFGSKEAEDIPQISAELAYHHVAELSSASYKGRRPGEAGNVMAAMYIADTFAEIGLTPGGDYRTYFQYYNPYDLSHIDASELGVANVIGVLPSPGASQTVIISAHFDHLGVRQEDGEIFHGAADNASGVGVMLELARAIVNDKRTLPFNVEFIGFNSEEQGMVGSEYYLRARLEAARNIIAVLNLDVVGVAEGSLTIIDGEGLSTLTKALQATAQRLKLKTQWDGQNKRSDHAPFATAGIQAITLIHYSDHYFDNYYHSPLDTIGLISIDKLKEPAEIILKFLYDLSVNYTAPRQSMVYREAA